MKIYLYCHKNFNPDMEAYWNKYFSNEDDVEVVCGDICQAKVDAIVSPANSYGFMNGGLDAKLTLRFGETVSNDIQQVLREEYGRELLIGESVCVETHDNKCPYVICSPTMIIPMNISNTINVFLSTRASLIEASINKLNSIAFSAMGTGVGKFPKDVCAKQMYLAYREFKDGWGQPDYLCEAIKSYKELL